MKNTFSLYERQQNLYMTLASKPDKNFRKLNESDLVLNKSSLAQHIKNEIIQYIDGEVDIERLSEILTFVTRKLVTKRGNRYTVSPGEIGEAIREHLSQDNK